MNYKNLWLLIIPFICLVAGAAIERGNLDIKGTLTLSNLTVSTVPYLSASKVVTSSSVTPTELGYLSGVTSAIQTQLATNAAPSGSIMAYAGSSAPTGWQFCYGQAINRTTYAALFSAISTNYGVGNGSTTFNVPDFRGRFLAGKDDMGGSAASRLTTAGGLSSNNALAATGGSQTHTHDIPFGTVGGDIAITDNNSTGSNTFGTTWRVARTSVTSATVGSTVSFAANSMAPTIVVNYIIKE